MSRPGEVGGRGVLDGDLAVAARAASCRPSGPRRRTGSRRPGSRARRAAGASRRRPGRWRRRCRRGPGVALIGRSRRRRRPRPRRRPGRRRCARRATASSTWSSSTITEMRISEVEIISMLMPASASAAKNFARDARVRAHAGADQRDLADLVVVEQRVEADLVAGCAASAVIAVWPSARGQREGDVGEAGRGGRDVLHDHVDVDLRRRPAPRRCARPRRPCRARRRR